MRKRISRWEELLKTEAALMKVKTEGTSAHKMEGDPWADEFENAAAKVKIPSAK
jgi:hypothetical protein